jgi:D-alanine-D-alanine ligase
VLHDLRNQLSNKLVIKPSNQGSTVGLTIVDSGNLEDIADAIRYAAQFSNNLIAERYIPGREITVGILDDKPLPVLEIIVEGGYYDYNHKYTKGKTKYDCPANLSEDIAEFTQNMALSAYNAVGCKGFARVDFILSEEGQPFCLEVNTIPGFTNSSLLPMAAKANGIEFDDLCEKLIHIALKSG